MINQGKIVLMGSGELTATMVTVHKELLRPYGEKCKAVFMDTPAGFQLNADLISQKAIDYFKTHVQHTLSVASFKSTERMPSGQIQAALDIINTCDYLLIGPGSPTYALRQWHASAFPEMIVERIRKGLCLVTASAAALAVGYLTIPVYEIYKVGEKPHWVKGLDLLGAFGLKLAVVPHWNNSEGGNHDTRFCFMGEERMADLELQLPSGIAILGVDEHTAVIIDLESRTFKVQGRGVATLQYLAERRVFEKNKNHAIKLLQTDTASGFQAASQKVNRSKARPDLANEADLLKELQNLAERISQRLLDGKAERDTRRLLEIEQLVWQRRTEASKSNSDASIRDIMRNLVVAYSSRVDALPDSWEACMAPLVEEIIALRQRLRLRKAWRMADELRDCLQRAKVIVTDLPEGTRWHKT